MLPMRIAGILPRLPRGCQRQGRELLCGGPAVLERGVTMDVLELMKYRRSIRKYEDKQISRADLEKIMEAGLYAPNAGGGQRARICALYNRELCEKIGRMNAAKFNRKNLAGS